MKILLLSFLTGYAWVMLRRWLAWVRLQPVVLPPAYKPRTNVSVIISVRNESENIIRLLEDLSGQSYPRYLLEVLVVDDHSEDNSEALVKDFAQTATYNLRWISLTYQAGKVGKKAAVATGVAAATGELLVLTDGDCWVQPDWLTYLEYMYTSRQAKFISGPVCFEPTHTLFQKLQLIEFAALIGTGGSSIALGKPNMCNGANLAYPKAVFEEVNGFAGNEHLPSGDDEFLMHKVHRLYPGSVHFIKAPGATVYTAAKLDLFSFFAQRVRWASKWTAYQSLHVKLLAVLVFGINFLLFLGAILALLNLFPAKMLGLVMAGKILIDLLFLAPVLRFFRKNKYLIFIVPLQVVYIPYVLATALTGLRGSYRWKGRKINA